MKKFSTIRCAFLVGVSIIVFAACQKEQSTTPVSQETASVPTDETRIVGVAGSAGQGVSPTYAGALAYNYSRKYDDENQAQYVVFDAATLSKFIANLQSKYGSTKIYVNFGVYGKGAPALNKKDDGRLTVFFTGDKIPAPSAHRKTDGLLDVLEDEFLNHGNIYP